MDKSVCQVLRNRLNLIHWSMSDYVIHSTGQALGRGGLDVVKDAAGRSEERPSQATGYGIGFSGASAACVLDNIDPLAKLAAKR